ncbi:unnamed protein product [Hydatigera taeniaeformis]|uniref:Uncharacterized protein n=1 Tax=Hydatigena taeniaeformis TaxID=6205 RepID=A0A3P7EM11_HYDTA|nr:unnamed protein product [Hydatigera taeniaeformis]
MRHKAGDCGTPSQWVWQKCDGETTDTPIALQTPFMWNAHHQHQHSITITIIGIIVVVINFLVVVVVVVVVVIHHCIPYLTPLAMQTTHLQTSNPMLDPPSIVGHADTLVNANEAACRLEDHPSSGLPKSRSILASSALSTELPVNCPMLCFLLLWSVTFITYPYVTAGPAGRPLYAIWVFVLFFSLSAHFVVVPGTCTRVFGHVHMATIYGLVYFATVSALLHPLTSLSVCPFLAHTSNSTIPIPLCLPLNASAPPCVCASFHSTVSFLPPYPPCDLVRVTLSCVFLLAHGLHFEAQDPLAQIYCKQF